MTELHVWFFTGLVLTLILKPNGLGSTLASKLDEKIPFKKIVKDYFFGDAASGWTTVVTFFVGWLGLGIYLGEVAQVADLATLEWVGSLPRHPAVAGLLGIVFELSAPGVVKWFVKKLGG